MEIEKCFEEYVGKETIEDYEGLLQDFGIYFLIRKLHFCKKGLERKVVVDEIKKGFSEYE